MWQKLYAIQIAAQLPHDLDDTDLILKYARKIIAEAQLPCLAERDPLVVGAVGISPSN